MTYVKDTWHPSIVEAIQSTLVELSEDKSDGYGGAAFHITENIDVAVKGGQVVIFDHDYKKPLQKLRGGFYGREAEVLPRMQETAQKAFDTYKSDLLNVLEVACTEFEKLHGTRPDTVELEKPWSDFVRLITGYGKGFSFAGLKVNGRDHSTPNRLLSSTHGRFMNIVLPRYAKDYVTKVYP